MEAGTPWQDDEVTPQTINWHSTSSEWESRTAMNNYGQRVMSHWKTWLPNRYNQLEDPISFFTSVGEQVEEQVLQIAGAMEAEQHEAMSRMDYLQVVGRTNAIQKSAEEIALSEFLLEPEPQMQEPETPLEPTWQDPPWMDEEGMPTDPSHPLWAMSQDDSVSVQEFLAACKEWEQQERVKHA
ncbi:hypothetical protein ACX31A_15230 [Dermacoccus nishinomiyaensis]